MCRKKLFDLASNTTHLNKLEHWEITERKNKKGIGMKIKNDKYTGYFSCIGDIAYKYIHIYIVTNYTVSEINSIEDTVRKKVCKTIYGASL